LKSFIGLQKFEYTFRRRGLQIQDSRFKIILPLNLESVISNLEFGEAVICNVKIKYGIFLKASRFSEKICKIQR